MKAFVSQRKNSENQLRLRLEEAKASLSTARGDNEALRADLAEARSREESMDARLHEAEDEVALLRGEVRQLRTEVSIEKKQKEDLQLRLSVQKEELEGEFATEREKLEADYQKQVDDMFFFGYRCYMKKHGINGMSLPFLRVKRRSCLTSLLPDSFSFCNFCCYLLFVLVVRRPLCIYLHKY
ncbi:hypothetical protein CK203_099084 [Vitis vinifera]|uniref:Uncharacterized protein n=1 Tax=Vitis vinifera TaxID=29760 RepID=A0A438BTN0_VITVI|nr:hypothetical protein CK203_099084 [Vitis vinifera]